MNDHGLEQFLTCSFTAIRRQHPESRLLVLGTVAEALTEPVPGVEPIGPVEDPTPYYLTASVVLNTAACGTGLKIKTVDALCHGKCLVSTPAGVQGLEETDGAFFVARDWDAFVGTISQLFAKPDVRFRTEDRALELARRCFDPSTVFGRLEGTLLAMAGRRVAPSWSGPAGQRG